jgi:hypothetical protein
MKVLKWAAIGIGGLFALLIVIGILVGVPEDTEPPPAGAGVPLEMPAKEEEDTPTPRRWRSRPPRHRRFLHQRRSPALGMALTSFVRILRRAPTDRRGLVHVTGHGSAGSAVNSMTSPQTATIRLRS